MRSCDIFFCRGGGGGGKDRNPTSKRRGVSSNKIGTALIMDNSIYPLFSLCLFEEDIEIKEGLC